MSGVLPNLGAMFPPTEEKLKHTTTCDRCGKEQDYEGDYYNDSPKDWHSDRDDGGTLCPKCWNLFNNWQMIFYELKYGKALEKFIAEIKIEEQI